MLCLAAHVSVAYVRGVVYTEADAHDEVDHGDAVQVHLPKRHVPGHPHFDGDHAERDPQRAQHVRDEDEGY